MQSGVEETRFAVGGEGVEEAEEEVEVGFGMIETAGIFSLVKLATAIGWFSDI